MHGGEDTYPLANYVRENDTASGAERESFLVNGYGSDFNVHKKDSVIDIKPPACDDKTRTEKDDEEEKEKAYDDWDDDDVDDDGKSNFLTMVVLGFQNLVKWFFSWLTRVTRGCFFKVTLLLAYLAYLIMAIMYKHEGEDFWRLIAFTILGIFIAIRLKLMQLIKCLVVKMFGSDSLSDLQRQRLDTVRFFIRWFVYAMLAAMMFYITYMEGVKSLNSLKSLPGLIIVLILCLFMSNNPKKIHWHTIYVSLALQFLCAVLFLKWSFGREALFWVQARLDSFFSNSKAGSVFLFGEAYMDHYVVFGALPLIFLTGATMAVLYHLGAMQLVINAVGSFLSFVLDADPIESTSVAAGIFMEGVLATVSLKPFLSSLTKSQLFVVMTSAFASLGGAYLGVLVGMGIPLEYILPAMMISAPATFTVCKLIFPETKKRVKFSKDMDLQIEKHSNILEACQNGSVSMIPLISNIVVIIFVFMSVISIMENTLEWFGDRVGIENLSLAVVFSYLLYPIPLAMGIEDADCQTVATLWGYRITSSNMVAFLKLIEMRGNRAQYLSYLEQTNYTGAVTYNGVHNMILEDWNKTLTGGMMSVRSEAIVTYSLCGFSSILSVGITLSVFYTFLPQRKRWLTSIPFHALVAGNVANLMTGCFASFFY